MERERKRDPSMLVFLRDKRTMDGLFDPRIAPRMLGLASKLSSKLSNEQKIKDVGTLIAGLGKDDEVWNVDRRDGALILLSRINLQRLDPLFLKDEYLKSVKKQDEFSEPFGSIDSLLDAGKMISPYLAQEDEAKGEVVEVWHSVADKMQGKSEWNSISTKFHELMNVFQPEEREEKENSKPPLFKHQVQEMWNLGNEITEIIIFTGKPRNVVSKALNSLRREGAALRQGKEGVDTEPKPSVAMRRQHVKRLLFEDKTIQEVSDNLKVPYSTIKNDIYVLREQGEELHIKKCKPGRKPSKKSI